MLSQTCPNKRGVKVLKTMPRLSEINEMRTAVSGPEKAGVGGSTPSLATIILKQLAALSRNSQPTIQPTIRRFDPRFLTER
jgi:hypothetical protein